MTQAEIAKSVDLAPYNLTDWLKGRGILGVPLGYPPHIIEHQLAHGVRDPLGRAYNRTAHLEQRKEMMQVWSDYLDKLKTG